MIKQAGKRNAFTLLELLVVIVIMAILAAILATKFSQIRENGWATACKGHLRSLHQAALNFANDNGGNFPHAGPFETFDPSAQTYSENKGWVNWTGTGTWPSGPNPCPGVNLQPSTWFGAAARTSITNGSLWDYIGHDRTAYFCPKFRSLMQGSDVARSYVMNFCFGCAAAANTISLTGYPGEASRTLMFADMQNQRQYPGATPAGNMPNVCSAWAGSSIQGNDGVLEAGSAPSGYVTTESIGFIHPMSGAYYGHAVFMDGQVLAIGLKQQQSGGAVTWSNRTYDACIGQY